MKEAVISGIQSGLTKGIVAIAIWPIYCLLLWWIDHIGLLEWAALPSPTLRQMLLLAAVAAYIAA